MPARSPLIHAPMLASTLARELPSAVIETSPSEHTITVEGARGAYTLTLTSETSDFAQTATVEVHLSQPPGYDEPLPEPERMTIPHGLISQTSDYGTRLRVNHRTLASQTAQVITNFESSHTVLSAHATH